MMKSNNDSGLTAKRSNRLLAAGLTAVLTAAFFAACSTANSIPIDDAYYSPEVEKGDLPTPSVPVTHVNQTTQTTSNTPTTQSIEYLNVQDTTVTIRIKK